MLRCRRGVSDAGIDVGQDNRLPIVLGAAWGEKMKQSTAKLEPRSGPSADESE